MNTVVDATATDADHDEFAALRHDITQLLATGLLLSDVSQDSGSPGWAITRLRVLHDQLEQAAVLLSRLNHLPGDESSEGHHDICQSDLDQVARVCVDAANPTCDVSLDIDPHHEHLVWGDPVLLRRAVNNLIDNACRAAGATGRVIVRVGADAKYRWIEVEDDGPGFGAIRTGTGVGLTVVRRAVEHGGGRLQTGRGPGTKLRMSFPAPKGHRR